jgi:hypothetical protein
MRAAWPSVEALARTSGALASLGSGRASRSHLDPPRLPRVKKCAASLSSLAPRPIERAPPPTPGEVSANVSTTPASASLVERN